MEHVETLGKIASVAVLGLGRLEIGWDDGQVATVDISETIAARAALAPLRDREEFARLSISDDSWSLEWPCGVEFGATQLRRWADEQAGEIMPPALFRAWIEKHQLTQEHAAQALGLSRRMIAYYLNGEKPIPKTVWLATEGYAARRTA